jgi:hypothetical protein
VHAGNHGFHEAVGWVEAGSWIGGMSCGGPGQSPTADLRVRSAKLTLRNHATYCGKMRQIAP